MIERHLLGEVTLKIDGFDTSSLSEKLYRVCKVVSLYTKSDSVFVTTIGTHEARVRELCEKHHCICETVEKRGAVYAVKRYIKRYGAAIGIIAAAALIFFLSNTVMKVEVVGTNDPEVIAEVKGVLREEGLKAGAYIPSLNFLELSNTLFTHLDSVAWASVRSMGSVVTVNISEPTHKTDAENTRIPCNIVASRDAVITRAEVKVGQLCVLLGDAVHKGEILVNGVIEHESGVTKYYHSYANIIGRYEENVVFTQKYTEETQLYGEKTYRKSLKFFELELPLPSSVLKQGQQYSEQSYEVPVKLLGLTLPISLKTYEYTEQRTDIKTYSTAEALQSLYRRLESYEQNILSDVEIIERTVTELQTDEAVMLLVQYLLEGEVGEVSEIYIK